METLYINNASHKRYTVHIRDFLISAFAALGMCALFFPFAGTTAVKFAMALCSAAVAGVCRISYYRREGADYTKMIIVILLVIAAVAMFGNFSRGLIYHLNTVVALINKRYGSGLLRVNASVATAADSASFLVIVLSSISLVMSALIEKKKYAAVCLIVFAAYVCTALLGVAMSAAAMAAVVLAIVGCLVAMSAPDTVRVRSFTVVCVVSTAIAVIGSAALSGFGGSVEVAAFQSRAKESAHALRYGKSSLPSGNMFRAAAMNRNSAAQLRVKMSVPESLYLGGYAGMEFKDGKWGRGPWTGDGEWYGLFRWLDDEGCDTHAIYAANAVKSGVETAPIEVNVENVGTDRSYIYAPFSLVSVTDGKRKGNFDLGIRAGGIFGASSYGMDVLQTPDVTNLLLSYTTDAQIRDSAENVYHAFIMENCTVLDDNIRQEMLDTFYDTDYLTESSGLYSVISRIRAVLELRAKYTETPAEYTGGEEFSTWFLNEAKTGNSAYFATVGVLALRAGGYAARYREGYVMSAAKGTDAELTEKDAHAWAETYIVGCGWVPVEFSPGYYDDTLLTEQTVELSIDDVSAAGGSDSSYTSSEQLPQNDTPTPEPSQSDGIRRYYAQIAGIAAAAAAAAILAILARFAFIRLKRRRDFKKPQPENAMYSYIFDIIRLGGVKCNRLKPAECREELTEKFPGIRPQEYMRMVTLMQKSVFGQTPLKPFELRSIRLFSGKLRGVLYKNSGIVKKWKLRLINVI